MSGRVAILLLAAGGSSRFGSPKLLEKIAGTALVRHAAIEALATEPFRVCLILGFAAEAIAEEVSDLAVTVVRNDDWQEGIGGSIARGVNALLLHNPDAVVVMLADQPLVTSTDVGQLIREWRRTSAPVVAASYDGVAGVPALFDRSVLPELLALRGDEGAKLVIRRNAQTRVIDMPHAAADIDTRADLESMKIR